LEDIPVRSGAGEKGVVARVDEDMQDRVLEGAIDGMSVRLPATVGEIELDAAAHDLALVDPDGGSLKIRTGLAVPDSKLHDLDRLPARAAEAPPKISRKPPSLELEFVWVTGGREKSALLYATNLAQLLVALSRGRMDQHAAGFG